VSLSVEYHIEGYARSLTSCRKNGMGMGRAYEYAGPRAPAARRELALHKAIASLLIVTSRSAKIQLRVKSLTLSILE
jgi:hypothetical protein